MVEVDDCMQDHDGDDEYADDYDYAETGESHNDDRDAVADDHYNADECDDDDTDDDNDDDDHNFVSCVNLIT